VPFISIVCTARQAAKPPRAATFLSTISAAVNFGALGFVSDPAIDSGSKVTTRLAQSRFRLFIERFSFTCTWIPRGARKLITLSENSIQNTLCSNVVLERGCPFFHPQGQSDPGPTVDQARLCPHFTS
jgi:hypothetical protein